MAIDFVIYCFDSTESVASGRWETWHNLRFGIESACRDFQFVAAVGNTREATRNLYNWNARILEEVQAVETALAEEIASRGWGDGAL